MRIRVNSAFVTKFNEAIRDMEYASGLLIDADDYYTEGPSVPRQLAIEEFLTRMAPDLARVLKHHLLQTLLEDAAAREREAVDNAQVPAKLVLDSIGPIT